jgi:hypothetical protein
VRLPTLKSAPVWLPIAFLLKDIAAWVYVFSYEPGITDKAVRIHHFLLIPGVFFGVELAIPLNLAFGVALGFALRAAAARHFPVVFTLAIMTWNFFLTGLLDFVADKSESVHRLFRVGMQPGRYLAHFLTSWKILSNPHLLFATVLATNIFVAAVATAAYMRIRPNRRESVVTD